MIQRDLERGLVELLVDHGVVAAGSAALGPLHFDAHQARLRVAAGEASAAHFTFRNPERASALVNSYPWARGYISIALAYATSQGDGVASVAAYAAQNRYDDLRRVLLSATEFPGHEGVRAVSVYDANHAFDKGLARRGGVGFVGRHSLVMVPKFGARVVLGSIVTAKELNVSLGQHFRVDPCRGCRRCIDACPTAAIVAPGRVIANRCIADVLQRESWSRDDRRSVGVRVYGCDTCIDACPVGWRSRLPVEEAPLARWLVADDEHLLMEVGNWYIPRRDTYFVRRNIANALRNRGSLTLAERGALARLCLSDDRRLRREALRTLLAIRWGP